MGIRRSLALGALIAACGDNLEPAPDPDQLVLVSLDTFAPAQVTAGDTIGITCTMHENEITTTVVADIRVVDEGKVARVGGGIIARKVGLIEVACALPARGVVDPTPALVEILAGPPANVVTTVTPNPVIAGNDISVTCEVFDGFGNLVEDQMPTLQLAPIDPINTVTDLTATMIRAGHYIAACQLPGTQSNNAGFDVLPNVPATIALSKVPDQPVYAVGEAITFVYEVHDRYDNEVFTAPVNLTSAPLTGVGPTTMVNASVFQYGGEGSYRVTATVAPPTEMGLPVTAYVDVLINSTGPAIVCSGDASMRNVAPPAAMTVSGTANDVNGVASITVNGVSVPVGAGGSFSRSIATRFGMNFVSVTATDTFGEPTTRVCTFLVTNRWANPANPVGDMVSLKMVQDAVDDGDRSGALDSLGDILHAVVNSSGLRSAVHSALLAANPLKPSSCDSQTCTIFGCICWYSSEVRYLDSRFDGPHTVSLSLVSGGISAVARFDNVNVRLRVRGSVGPFPYDTSGWVWVEYVEVRLTLDTAVVNGIPRITLRPGQVTSSAGQIMTSFGGLDGWIINNIVVPLAQGQLRTALRNIISSYISNNFNGLLDGLVSSLNITSLGTSFAVPKLGGGTVTLNFGIGFSSMATSSSRWLIGIGTRFSAATLNAFPTLGVALPPGTSITDPSLSLPQNTAVGAHVGVLNGALHALWKANYFSATVTGSQLGGGLPAAATINVTTRLPPVTYISTSNVAQIHLGAVDLVINHPDLPAGMAVRVGVEGHANVALVGNDLQFSALTIDQLHISTDTINLSPQGQTALQQLLTQVAQQYINSSLNNSLPAIPIPAFTIPASLGPFGLPVGSRLGIASPTLSLSPQHFTLRGRFGIVP
jgi:hypothetical protein